MRKKKQVKDVVAPKRPKLPTIAEFFVDMAAKQGEEIVRLKGEAAESSGEVLARRESGEVVVPYPWQLHPVRKSAPAKKPTPKKKAGIALKGNAKTKG